MEIDIPIHFKPVIFTATISMSMYAMLPWRPWLKG